MVIQSDVANLFTSLRLLAAFTVKWVWSSQELLLLVGNIKENMSEQSGKPIVESTVLELDSISICSLTKLPVYIDTLNSFKLVASS